MILIPWKLYFQFDLFVVKETVWCPLVIQDSGSL